jgi:hypothetical protein
MTRRGYDPTVDEAADFERALVGLIAEHGNAMSAPDLVDGLVDLGSFEGYLVLYVVDGSVESAVRLGTESPPLMGSRSTLFHTLLRPTRDAVDLDAGIERVEVGEPESVIVEFKRTYARAVGDQVAALVEKALASRYVADGPLLLDQTLVHRLADPGKVAEALDDLILTPAMAEDRSELADLLAPFWTAQRAQAALGISRQAMADRRKTGAILALKAADTDTYFYPVAQFETKDGAVRVKPMLRRFLMTLRHREPWTVGVLLHTPAPELENRTPLDWVRRHGDEGTLLDYARVVNAEFAH